MGSFSVHAVGAEFGDDWRVTVDIHQGKKLETVLLKFGSRAEIAELAERLQKSVSE